MVLPPRGLYKSRVDIIHCYHLSWFIVIHAHSDSIASVILATLSFRFEVHALIDMTVLESDK